MLDIDEPKLGDIARKALKLLADHPSGLTMRQMRDMTGFTEGQEHFNRRVRDIRKFFSLSTRREGGDTVYVLGPRRDQAAGLGVSEKLRAAVLQAAHGRCQMCGQTVQEWNRSSPRRETRSRR